MDVLELLSGEVPFVADTSAWWRFSSLPDELAGLIQAAVAAERMWITPIVRMEILYSARSSTEYIAFETDLDALRILRNDRAVTNAAMSAIGELAERSDGYHRVPFTDALIAAAAAEHGGVALLHRDTHFEKLAEVLTFQGVQLPAS
ncbi:MAG: PIN domain-containing protein [Solirubrobacteraceae bacterium]